MAVGKARCARWRESAFRILPVPGSTSLPFPGSQVSPIRNGDNNSCRCKSLSGLGEEIDSWRGTGSENGGGGWGAEQQGAETRGLRLHGNAQQSGEEAGFGNPELEVLKMPDSQRKLPPPWRKASWGVELCPRTGPLSGTAK